MNVITVRKERNADSSNQQRIKRNEKIFITLSYREEPHPAIYSSRERWLHNHCARAELQKLNAFNDDNYIDMCRICGERAYPA